MDQSFIQLAADLAVPERRFEAAQQIARRIGCEYLLILVEDLEVASLLPARGFPQTLPGGASWRALLKSARSPGLHHAEVVYPARGQMRRVTAHTRDGIVLVFVGGACSPPATGELDVIIPLLAATLRSEHAAYALRGELRAAQALASEKETLAKALDLARADVERTLRELESQRRVAEEARLHAEEAARAKDEFLAMLGHELRNPLSPIVTALQLMRLKNRVSREQDVIERQIVHLTRLVDDLLDVARIARGQIELRTRRVELSEVAARAIEMSAPELERKQHILSVDVPRGLVVDADPARLAQVLANLLTNAAKYSDEGSPVSVVAKARDGEVDIRVQDHGIGIAPEMLGRIFDQFVQQRQSIDRSQGGLGLGLAIVRSLVALHGGRVWAESDGQGQGSTFYVTLPAAAGHAGEAAAPPVQLPAAAVASGPPGRERVLVVDDNEDAAMMMAQALTELGYRVHTAPDALNALKAVGTFDPQIALLDIGLPVMDGYELAARLRTRADGQSLRLVAITGYGQETDRHRAQACGFDAHLVKPITLEDLEATLATLRANGVGSES